MANALSIRELTKRYDDGFLAVEDFDLEIEAGSFFGLLGPNGAGKTTAVRILSRLIKADEGTATVFGMDVDSQADAVRFTIGLTGQYAAVDEYLTGFENLEMVGRLYQLGKAESHSRATGLLERSIWRMPETGLPRPIPGGYVVDSTSRPR